MLILIAAVAIALVSLRPWRIPEWVWPVAGALVVILLAYDSAGGAMWAVARQWNVLLFILGLMGIAAAAEESGAFVWITDVLLERARGSRRSLFVWLFLTGAVLTLLLSNDATAIVLTPIVYRAVSKRGADPMPFLFACTFVADTASFGLPFANPANVLILPHARMLDYLVHLGPPQIAAIVVNLALFLLIFRSQLRGTYEFAVTPPPSPVVVRTLAAMLLAAVAYFAAVVFDWPLGIVAFLGAIVTLGSARVSPAKTAQHIGWSTFALLAGLFILLDALDRAGLAWWGLSQLERVSRLGTVALDGVAATAAALFSNVFNNLPIAVASSYVVARAPAEHLAYPLIVGVDLGPNLTTTGSLATILWLAALRGRGVRVSRREYLRLGFLVVPPTLAIAVLWLSIFR